MSKASSLSNRKPQAAFFRTRRIKIAPSLLSADFANLERDIKMIAKAGADLLHLDIMDAHFVPNLTVGPALIAAIRRTTKIPFDVHLMLDDPIDFIEPFAKAGADVISFHIEAKSDPLKTIKKIKSLGVAAALAINPATPLKKIEPYLKYLDMVLVMSVVPGFAGQKFMAEVLPKIIRLKKIRDRNKLKYSIEVDGGLGPANSAIVKKAGANILAAGSSVFLAPSPKAAIRRMRYN